MRKIFSFILTAAMILSAAASAGNLDDKIRAAQCDLKILAPAITPGDIQWSALMYLNQKYGAEIHILVLHPSPEFGYKTVSSDDGQFHLAYIGRSAGLDDSAFADTICQSLFMGNYPDLAIFGASSAGDSAGLASLLMQIKNISAADTTAMTRLKDIYVFGQEVTDAAVVLNDEELYHRYREKFKDLVPLFASYGPDKYLPERFRRYFLLASDRENKSGGNDFVSGIDVFRLPDFISARLFDGPPRQNALNRLGRYRSYMRAAEKKWTGPTEQLRLLGAAYQELIWLMESMGTDPGDLWDAQIIHWTEHLRQKALLAVTEALGLDWNAYLEMRRTPFGQTAKLTLDMHLTGPRKIELSFFKFHPRGRPAFVVDSISKIIDPHQRFYREYPVDLKDIDITGQTGDSLLFSLEVIIEGLPLELLVPYREYQRQDIELKFLPGYAFLAPFTQDDITALAQPFDWQIMVGKPFGSELEGKLKIITPEAVVVGSFNENIYMPPGTTQKYLNIYLAAGRSIGSDRQIVRAVLEVGGRDVAETSAAVSILSGQVAETRDIALIPDQDGQVEDFLRAIKASFQPLTRHGLIRAPLEAYDVIVIGTGAEDYYSTLRAVSSRLRSFVKNGGDIVIFGQPFGWPNDIFEFPIYAARSIRPAPPKFIEADHPLFNKPYNVSISRLSKQLTAGENFYYSAIMNAGQEVIAAGEHGSYLKVTKNNEGYVIYCGLPLLDMAADLNPDAVHLLTNLLSFDHGR